MKFIRLYTGADGHSHIEELDWESRPDFTDLHGAKGVVFRAAEPGRFSDWHVAPRRQYVITLAGEGEIGLRDGTKYRLGPGDVNLAEDTSGDGHTTAVVSGTPRVTVTVHLAD